MADINWVGDGADVNYAGVLNQNNKTMTVVTDGIARVIDFLESGFTNESLEYRSEWWGLRPDVYRIEKLTEKQSMSIVSYMLGAGAVYGCRYGFWHLITTGILIMMPKWMGKLFRWECARHAPHCSESVCGAFRWAIDVDLVPTMPDWYTSPGDIVRSKKVEQVS